MLNLCCYGVCHAFNFDQSQVKSHEGPTCVRVCGFCKLVFSTRSIEYSIVRASFRQGPLGGPSSSCDMITLHNNSHGGIIRVCVGIFTTVVRNKTIRRILNKNISPYFHSVSLVIWPLTLMKRTLFSELPISRSWRTLLTKRIYANEAEVDLRYAWQLLIVREELA